jgi:hypothetical protein
MEFSLFVQPGLGEEFGNIFIQAARPVSDFMTKSADIDVNRKKVCCSGRSCVLQETGSLITGVGLSRSRDESKFCSRIAFSGSQKLLVVGEIHQVMIGDFVIFIVRSMEDCEQDSVEGVEVRGVMHNGMPRSWIPWCAHLSGYIRSVGSPIRGTKSKNRDNDA